jgi:hypothetical protein
VQDLIRRINSTNAGTRIGPDGTITDVLRARHSVVAAGAAAAAGRGQGMGQLLSEL